MRRWGCETGFGLGFLGSQKSSEPKIPTPEGRGEGRGYILRIIHRCLRWAEADKALDICIWSPWPRPFVPHPVPGPV